MSRRTQREVVEIPDCEIEIVDTGWETSPTSDVRVRAASPFGDEADENAEPTAVSGVIRDLARLGNLSCVPRKLKAEVPDVLPANASLLWSRIDGRTTLAILLSTCALSEPEALGVMAMLVQRGYLTFASSR